MMARLKFQRDCLWILIPLLLWTASELRAADRPNILLILVDDLRPELGCYGVDYIQSPHIDGLAARGRLFTRHYVQAPTCGASRYALLTGCYGPYSNHALFQRATNMKQNLVVPVSMPEWFRQHGYTTVSVGKVSHHPGGRGGPDWDQQGQLEMPAAWDRHLQPVGDWRHPRGVMHGLANGEVRFNQAQMAIFQSHDGDDASYPDGLITEEAIGELERLMQDTDQPYFLAVGLIRPHLPFGAPAQYMEPYRDIQLPPIPFPHKPLGRTTWHASGEFMGYQRWGRNPNQDAEFAEEVRKHYAACVSYADAQVGRILDCLQREGGWENTIVVLWGDHGFHLGEHGIWGKHSLFEESLRSPLIVYHPQLPSPGTGTESIVQSIDLFPTLCELSRIQSPEGLDGRSLVPSIDQPALSGGVAISYLQQVHTIRTDGYRLIEHRDGFCELYDHRSQAKESENISSQAPEIVAELREKLRQRWPVKRE